MPRPEIGVISLHHTGKSSREGWAFPKGISDKLQVDFAGMSILHLFGGKADFGTRLDIDPLVRPDVIGDAWLPPFADASFDVVILDPPYVLLNGQVTYALLLTAAAIARRMVVWFHTQWRDRDGAWLKLDAAWLVIVGRAHAVRCLEYFSTTETRAVRPSHFTRGPAMKYNRWISQPQGLPFG